MFEEVAFVSFCQFLWMSANIVSFPLSWSEANSKCLWVDTSSQVWLAFPNPIFLPTKLEFRHKLQGPMLTTMVPTYHSPIGIVQWPRLLLLLNILTGSTSIANRTIVSADIVHTHVLCLYTFSLYELYSCTTSTVPSNVCLLQNYYIRIDPNLCEHK
jgi:hypothetical protein